MAITRIITPAVNDDAVTLAKMAPGTDGNIISYDASGNPVAVATGSSGQVLTSAGAGAVPSFQAAAAGGKILQVLTDTTTTQVSITGTAQTATGLSLAITPSATSSKIAIFANISSIVKYGGDTNVNLNLTRGGSGISNFGAALGDDGNSYYSSVAGQGVSYLDSPNTTSATTYAVTFGKGNSSGTARVQQSSGMSTMIVMEIGV